MNQPPYNPYSQPGNFGTPQQPRSRWLRPLRWYGRQRQGPQLIIGCAGLVVMLILCGVCGQVTGIAKQSSPTTHTSQSSHKKPAHATTKPTARPTTVASRPTVATTVKPTADPATSPTKPAATPVRPTPTPSGNPANARLGGTLADFEARYGRLNSHSDPAHGAYYFAVYGNDKNDLSLQFIYNNHTDGILYGAPPSHMWSYTDAKAACGGLLPPDATYQRKMTVFDPTTGQAMDEQLVYYSPSLAKLFPASAFNDENGNPTKPGTIGLILSHWDTNTYVQCAVQAGLESK